MNVESEDERFSRWSSLNGEGRAKLYSNVVFEEKFGSDYGSQYSVFAQLLESLCLPLSASLEGKSPEDAPWELEKAESLANAIFNLVDDHREEASPNFWWHSKTFLQDAKEGKPSPVSREEVERVTSHYLSGSLRSRYADRLLVDMLLYAEIHAFAVEVFRQRKAQRFLGGGPSAFLLGRGCSILMVVALGGLAYFLSTIGLFGETVLLWIFAIVGGLFLVETAWTVLRFPFTWRGQARHNQTTVKLLSDMNGVYSELNSEGPISARHIRERAQAVSAGGAVWPGPLFVLLEDILDRGGRL